MAALPFATDIGISMSNNSFKLCEILCSNFHKQKAISVYLISSNKPSKAKIEDSKGDD